MDNAASCKNCGATSIIVDPVSTVRVCTSCGCEQSYDNFQFHFSVDGPQGTFVHVGDFDYRQRKSYNARNQIADVASSLGLSAARTSDLTAMIERITEGEFGAGRWFSVLIAACAHVVTRETGLPLSISEIAAATGHGVHEIGRMLGRVVEFMELQLPAFDVLAALDRAVKNCGCFAGVSAEKLEEMAKQGRFIIQCCVKWYLTTGRQPLPVVAAVLAFVAEVNRVGLTVDDLARDISAGVTTSRRRYKELKETLVKVARALPWGKDVTVKNLARNAPSLLQYMARKSKEKSLNSEPALLDLGEVANECTRKEFEYTADGYVAKKDSVYFDVEEHKEGARCDDLEKLKLPEDCLQRAYRDFESGFDALRSKCGEIEMKCRGKRKRGSEFMEYNEVLVGELDSGELDSNGRPSLEEIVEKNVGFDAFPPSFVASEEARKRRREKINGAKLRIEEIMNPTTDGSVADEKKILDKQLQARKECQRRVREWGIDWEDCTIELLLLHGVKEEEIEQGNYKRLLELHVFSS